MASLPGALALALLAGAHVGGEWSGRTMKNLLTQHGRRWRVLAAKLVSLWLAGVGLIAACWAGAGRGRAGRSASLDHLPAPHESLHHALSLAGSQVARALLVLAVFAAIGLLAAVLTRDTIGTMAATAGAIVAMLVAAVAARHRPVDARRPGCRAGWASRPGSASITSLPTNFWSRFISATAPPPASWSAWPGLAGCCWPCAGRSRRGCSAAPTSAGEPRMTRPTVPHRVMRHRSDMRVPVAGAGRARRVDLLIAAGLLVWGLPDVPWWWEPSGPRGLRPGRARLAGADAGHVGAVLLAAPVSRCRCSAWPRACWRSGPRCTANEVSAFAAVLVGAYGLGAYRQPARRYARWLGWAALAGGGRRGGRRGNGSRLAARATGAARRRVRARRRGQRPARGGRRRGRGGAPGRAHPHRPRTARRGRAPAVRHRRAGGRGPDGRGRQAAGPAEVLAPSSSWPGRR